MSVSKPKVELVEVAPRDGFQSISEPISTSRKITIIQGLIAAGFRRIELGSFVSPKAVPQMADMSAIAQHFRDLTDLRLSALVANQRGVAQAREQGVTEIVYVLSASEEHNFRNVRRTVAQSLADLRCIVGMDESYAGESLRVDIATAFDCPFEGRVPIERLEGVIQGVLEASANCEIALCDTTGRASPHQVRNCFARMRDKYERVACGWAFHGHDTFGLGVANALFAYEAGVRAIDVSASGLGGCPFAPGATGNTSSEDVVFAFEQGGIETGIDLERLLNVAEMVSSLPGAQVGGHVRNLPRDRTRLDRTMGRAHLGDS